MLHSLLFAWQMTYIDLTGDSPNRALVAQEPSALYAVKNL